jgi:flagellar basal-body rod modification protein FlgD
VADNAITISDSKGKTIRSLTGETGQGAHSITWDGKDSNGQQVADGVYKIAISAANADKTQASATIGISGVVTGVTLVDQKPMLAIGGVTVPMENVLSVSGVTGSGI